jgi:hypothetical protein
MVSGGYPYRVSVFVWWVIPLVALIAGIVWAYRVSRPAKPAEMQESMESFSRFRQALAHQRPTHARPVPVEDVEAPQTVTRSPR